MVNVDVRAPQPVALFQPQRIKRATTGCHAAMLLAGLPERVPECQAILAARINLPAQLTGIGDAQRQRRRHANRHMLRREVWERAAGDICVACLCQHRARARPPQSNRCVSGGFVRDGNRAVPRRMRPQPRQMNRPAAAACQHPEAIRREARDGEVRHNARAPIAQAGVNHFANRHINLVGGHVI